MPSLISRWDTIIVGAGPAGLSAAACCSGKTLVVDRMDQACRKLLISGGGRCNITHDTDADGIMDGFGRNGRFMRQALRSFGPAEIRSFLGDRGVPTLSDGDGCVFPSSQKAGDIRDALAAAAAECGAEFRFGCSANRVIIEDGRACGVSTDQGELFAGRVILAAGGRSYPETGSDGSGFVIAEAVGLSVVRPVPALAGLYIKKNWAAELAGTTLPNARVRLMGKGPEKNGFVGPVLFTHRGISGPPVLAVSGAVAEKLAQGEKYVSLEVSVDADRAESEWLNQFEDWRLIAGSKKIAAQLGFSLTKRMAQLVCQEKGIDGETTCARLRKEDSLRLARFLGGMPLTVTGTEGWKRAMVTRGGVALKELDPGSMQCRRVPRLYCVGEIVDLDGVCGGYNLTWALASGRLAGADRPE